MPAVKCPVPDCQYETDDLDAVVVAALLTTHATVHSAAAGAIVSAKVEKVKRPTVASAGSSEDCTYFVSRWKDYIQATKVSGKDLVIQLLECCDETLRRDITRSAGGSLVDKSEQEVLAAMRTLAVREENTMVARVSLHGMTQDRDETVRSFGARLRGQASDVNKMSTTQKLILRDVLTRGLSDPDIQLDLLGDKNQDMTLEQVFKFVEAKEAGKRSASRLLDSHGAEAASSSYRRKRNANVAKDTKKYDNNKGKEPSNLIIIFTRRCIAHGLKRPSQPQPFINIVVKVVEDDYKQLGFQNSLVSQQRSTVIPAMADTGCQSCLAGIKVLYKIGLTKRDLIPNGKSRRTVDFQALNAHAIRETHHTQSPFHQARSVPRGKKKTVFDAWNGYHSVPIREEDRHLTTFITPWGRYRYKTAPQGYIASGDGYTRRFDEIVADVPHKTKCVDDTLLWSDDIEESFVQACHWLELCGKHGITLNPEKFHFAQDTVEFAGFEITNDSVRPCKRYLQAILDFPTPKNITDVRSWFGLVNQVSYAFSMADRLKTISSIDQNLVHHFFGINQLETLFQETKTVIVSEIEEGVRIFDKSKPTCLATDWSKSGLGFWLFQKHCNCQKLLPFCCNEGWKITLVGSRFTHGAESRYAPVEGEALAVVDALDKARFQTPGYETSRKKHHALQVQNDACPKEQNIVLPMPFTRNPTGNNSEELKLIDDIALITEDSNQFDYLSFQTIHTIFLSSIMKDDCWMYVQTKNFQLAAASSTWSINTLQSITWNMVHVATNSDDDMVKLVEIIENGMPEFRHEMPTELREFFQFREDLYTVDGVVMYKDRIVIPPALRKNVLTILHSAHQGVTSMMSRADSSVFWP
ncbi:Hypothetical predicted protein [Mytilus galloprovincialis]|uniref:Reverse transcriptase domain-containing protein n=1 Tax=Mytilus galloprovincialis TaxID=29158 RepID=A0A8B6F9J6_MYTGA|nr:Hypothetical predicted protein [Mytilus galloprovincialis]